MESSLELSSSLGSMSSMVSRFRTFKVVVIGDSGVGKTCLTHRLCAGEFPARAEATIGVDFRETAVHVDGETVKLQLWDTAGQERFRKSMVQHYYRNVNAVLFVYDVTCPASFNGLAAWIEECRQNSLGLDIPRLLVGNKCDLRDPAKADRQVSLEQALSFAKAHGMAFFETSAKTSSSGDANGRRGRRQSNKEASGLQNKVEDIGAALAARLKRQKIAAETKPAAHNSSFNIAARKEPEKEALGCC